MDANFKKQVFNAGATLYDLFTSQKTWRKHCRKLSPEDETFDSILDLGCGPGVSSFVLEEIHPDARVVGLDIAEKMIDRARHQKRERNSTVEFILGNAETLPFSDDQFDLVTGHSFLYLLDDAERVLTEVQRVLRPGGGVTFLEPRAKPGLSWFVHSLLEGPRFFCTMVGWQISSTISGRFDESELEALFRAIGFDSPRTEITLNGLGWILRATN